MKTTGLDRVWLDWVGLNKDVVITAGERRDALRNWGHWRKLKPWELEWLERKDAEWMRQQGLVVAEPFAWQQPWLLRAMGPTT